MMGERKIIQTSPVSSIASTVVPNIIKLALKVTQFLLPDRTLPNCSGKIIFEICFTYFKFNVAISVDFGRRQNGVNFAGFLRRKSHFNHAV